MFSLAQPFWGVGLPLAPQGKSGGEARGGQPLGGRSGRGVGVLENLATQFLENRPAEQRGTRRSASISLENRCGMGASETHPGVGLGVGVVLVLGWAFLSVFRRYLAPCGILREEGPSIASDTKIVWVAGQLCLWWDPGQGWARVLSALGAKRGDTKISPKKAGSRLQTKSQDWEPKALRKWCSAQRDSLPKTAVL